MVKKEGKEGKVTGSIPLANTNWQLTFVDNKKKGKPSTHHKSMNSSTTSGALSLYSSIIIEPLEVFKTCHDEERGKQFTR